MAVCTSYQRVLGGELHMHSSRLTQPNKARAEGHALPPKRRYSSPLAQLAHRDEQSRTQPPGVVNGLQQTPNSKYGRHSRPKNDTYPLCQLQSPITSSIAAQPQPRHMGVKLANTTLRNASPRQGMGSVWGSVVQGLTEVDRRIQTICAASIAAESLTGMSCLLNIVRKGGGGGLGMK